jgi:hypothetical protein
MDFVYNIVVEIFTLIVLDILEWVVSFAMRKNDKEVVV